MVCGRHEGCGFLLLCVNMFARIHIYVHVVFQSHTPPYFLRWGSLIELDQLASKLQGSACLCPPWPWDYRHGEV